MFFVSAPIVWLPGIALITFVVYRMMRGYQSKCNNSKTVNTLVVLGSGGHTAEMLRLVSALNANKYKPISFIVAETDNSSINKLKEMNADSEIVIIPRSREVGQTWISTIFTTLNASMFCFSMLFKKQPDLLLCNGPGTCVPPCLVAYIYNKLFGRKTKIVFVESICRVKTLSLSGKILQYFADDVLVQWPELATRYQRVKYIARFT